MDSDEEDPGAEALREREREDELGRQANRPPSGQASPRGTQDAQQSAQPAGQAQLQPPAQLAEPRSQQQQEPTQDQLRDAARSLIREVDLYHTSTGDFRVLLLSKLALEPSALDARKEELDKIFKEVVAGHMAKKVGKAHSGDEELGEEAKDASRQTYLVTAAHTGKVHSEDGHKLKPPGAYSREQLCALMLAVLAATQGARNTPLVFLCMVIFQERHGSGHIHYHIALLADRCFRFNPLKKELLKQGGLATHWSCTHEGYSSCVAYGYLPSPKKPPEHLDPQPLCWAPPGQVHPPLDVASRAPVTAHATAKRREKERHAKAAEGKSEARFKEVDLWPIVIKENISNDELAAERVMQYAKRCGGHSMVEFCFRNWEKLPSLVERS
jgi:hypothetical protein